MKKGNFLPSPPKRSKLQDKPSALKRKRSALQTIKFMNFFLLFCIIFAHLDSFPDSQHSL